MRGIRVKRETTSKGYAHAGITFYFLYYALIFILSTRQGHPPTESAAGLNHDGLPLLILITGGGNSMRFDRIEGIVFLNDCVTVPLIVRISPARISAGSSPGIFTSPEQR
jgi:hypothetical protein